jgi:hypothetical protein
MNHIFKKYEFTDEAAADELIDALPHSEDEETGELYPDHKHAIVKLGHIVVTPGEYEQDEDGELVETTAPVLADNYSVDVLWQGIEEQPEDWAAYEIVIEDNGVHTFFGINYSEK